MGLVQRTEGEGERTPKKKQQAAKAKRLQGEMTFTFLRLTTVVSKPRLLVCALCSAPFCSLDQDNAARPRGLHSWPAARRWPDVYFFPF